MIVQTGKTKYKPTSRGQRKHVRRMKQEARKVSVPDTQMKQVMSIPVAPKE
jgi:hypothetical protein